MSAILTAAPTGGSAFPSDSGLGGETILGCPISSYLSLESACVATNIPPCATNTPEASWDAACCTSLFSFGTSVASCYSAHAPACLDTSALESSLSGSPATGVTDPCLAYLGGSTPQTASAGQASNTAVETTSTGTAETSASATGGSSESSNSAASGTTTASASASTSATAKSNIGVKVGAGLKVYIGVALIGALAVLSL